MTKPQQTPQSILVTGATGFVGGALIARLAAESTTLPVAAVRSPTTALPKHVKTVAVSSLTALGEAHSAWAGIDAVVHCAARVHVMNDTSQDPLKEFRQVNVVWTLELARAAATAGVKRFVFMSSIKVNGEQTELGHPFLADDLPAPIDAYGRSKLEAENGLREIAASTGMEVVIVRPTLVYGHGVKANFASMMRVVARGLPLPLGAVRCNRRSLVALDNLVDLIVTCLRHPAAANQTFLISDGEDLSTADLLRRVGGAFNKHARLFFVPTGLLKLGAALIGKPEIYQRLCGSLQVDIEKTRRLLDWSPPLSVDEGFCRAAENFKK